MLVPLGVVVGCAVLVLVGVRVTGDDDPAPATSVERAAGAGTERAAAREGASSPADPTTDRTDPLAAARELTERRLALLTGGTGDLGSVVVAGSPAETTDAALLTELEDVEVLGARADVFAVRAAGDAASGPADEAVVEVDYAVDAHRQRTGGEDVQVPRAPRTTVVLVLRWTDVGWRVAEVR
ncbi:hypothetical protein [Cellulosimicrobium sp. CUA-896]|uniref:hypothetical protein n=1 Tax=Cellulosimicrobium sp. CUA-896 TaxID=1517881 RepID=UPI00095F6343|nr:hypothetical protein [Cellulosimicrobium sp. CUA-896]OLT54047.1 hypothetical protein BJF88_00825 [Cellulosimicrobium sp. CUA-896]